MNWVKVWEHSSLFNLIHKHQSKKFLSAHLHPLQNTDITKADTFYWMRVCGFFDPSGFFSGVANNRHTENLDEAGIG